LADSTAVRTDYGDGNLGSKQKKAPERPRDPLLIELEGLVQDALAEREGSVQRLRAFLEDNPALWQLYGDLSRHARMSMVRAIAGENVILSESIMRQALELETQLVGPNPSRLERLSVERVVACWLEMQWVDTLNPLPQGQYLPQAKFNLKLKDSAQHRYHAAVKSLMLVRKMESAKARSKPASESDSKGPLLNGAAKNGRKRKGKDLAASTGKNGSLHTQQKGEGKDGDGHWPEPWQNRLNGLFDGQRTAETS